MVSSRTIASETWGVSLSLEAEVEGGEVSFGGSKFLFLTVVTDTEAPLAVKKAAGDFSWAGFLRSSVTVVGVGLSDLDSLGLGDLFPLRELDLPPFAMVKKMECRGQVFLIEGGCRQR